MTRRRKRMSLAVAAVVLVLASHGGGDGTGSTGTATALPTRQQQTMDAYASGEHRYVPYAKSASSAAYASYAASPVRRYHQATASTSGYRAYYDNAAFDHGDDDSFGNTDAFGNTNAYNNNNNEPVARRYSTKEASASRFSAQEASEWDSYASADTTSAEPLDASNLRSVHVDTNAVGSAVNSHGIPLSAQYEEADMEARRLALVRTNPMVNYAVGFGSGLAGTITGIANAVLNPIDTVRSVTDAVRHLPETAAAIANHAKETTQQKGVAYSVGYVSADAALAAAPMLISAKGASAAKAADVAGDAGSVAKAADVAGDAGAAAKLADVAGDAGTAARVVDAADDATDAARMADAAADSASTSRLVAEGTATGTTATAAGVDGAVSGLQGSGGLEFLDDGVQVAASNPAAVSAPPPNTQGFYERFSQSKLQHLEKLRELQADRVARAERANTARNFGQAERAYNQGGRQALARETVAAPSNGRARAAVAAEPSMNAAGHAENVRRDLSAAEARYNARVSGQRQLSEF